MMGFGIGRLSHSWPGSYPLVIESTEGNPVRSNSTAAAAIEETLREAPTSAAATNGTYVASRNGSAFHLPNCSGAKRIKDENRIWFRTKEEALRAGYKPAANCPGL